MVGYKVRFHDTLREGAAIKLMTDGILLAETQGDPRLRAVRHDHHRRGARAQPQHRFPARLPEEPGPAKRPDLKVVVTSATIDAERFSRHFAGAPVIEVSGRLYPVEVRYRPVEGDAEDTTRKEEEQALVDAVDELCREGEGDVLVFLPGEREIRDAAEVLRRARTCRGPKSCRCIRACRPPSRTACSSPAAQRRVVLATNVAETSLTVPRIRYVVDTGLARVKRYSYRNKVEMLHVENDLAGRREAACRALRPRRERHLHPAVLRGRLRASAPRSPIPKCCARRSPR